jgi:hypothetical protein
MISHFINFKKLSNAARFLVIMLCLVQGALIPLAVASPAKNGDFGTWNTYDLEKKINAQWKMKAGEELRLRDHNGLYYAETHVGVNYQPSKYLAMGAEYLENRGSRTAKKKQVWYWESVPRIYLTPQLPFKGFLLENRNMLEFKVRQDSRFAMRYRNLTTVTAPWKWTPLQFQPYTANEIFLETGKNGMVEDRFFAGFKVHWWGPVYGSIYYLRHSTKNAIAKWTSLNILGTGLKICF